MATLNESLVLEVSEFMTANNRPCPAKHLIGKFGAEAANAIVEMKKAGTLVGKRGRNGGLTPGIPNSNAVTA